MPSASFKIVACEALAIPLKFMVYYMLDYKIPRRSALVLVTITLGGLAMTLSSLANVNL